MTDSNAGTIYGLFIGVNCYESEDIRPLAFAAADALAVREKLANRFGLRYENTVVLADNVEGGSTPTRRQILRAMNRFAGAPMLPSDIFMFVFAGHGFACDGHTFLAACDSEVASEALLRETAVSLETVRDFLSQIPAGQQVLILDACRDAPIKGTRSIGSQAMSDDMTRDIGAVIQSTHSSRSKSFRASAILCSCWEGQVAHEYTKSGHGWFCYNLLEELDSAFQAELAMSDLHRRIKERMQNSAWRLLPAAKDQTPHLLIDGDVPKLRLIDITITTVATTPTLAQSETVAVREYCAVCGSQLGRETFRCTRCRKICCVTCKNKQWGVCAKCAEMIPSRAENPISQTNSLPKDKRQSNTVCLDFATVPKGEFQMGRKRSKRCIDSFEISATAVTCSEYSLFLHETGYHPQGKVSELLSKRQGNHPVGNVTYRDAEAFAEWMGCTLPNEEQWEKAARGTDGRPYPWGDSYDPSICNSAEAEHHGALAVDDMHRAASPFGCLQMSGNVWEWTSSWHDTSRTEKIIRGGSYQESRKACTCYYREGIDPRYSKPDLGFRCIR